ncbi:PQQ-binding-like beta-propeller repeat protein [Kitasatospora sp. NPDC001683]
MTTPLLRIDRILGDRPFAEVGEPALAVADQPCGLLAVAGSCEHRVVSPVGVYGTDDLTCWALLHSRYPVHTMAFHPGLPLLAVGTGSYDGGYHFQGELLLLDLETGAADSLLEHWAGREVLDLEWLDEQALRVLMSPPDDWQDYEAHVSGHVAVVRRPDWRAVPPGSITAEELAGPRVPAPRPDRREDARQALSGLSADWDPRHSVRAVEELPDGRILAALDPVVLESWLPSGERQWAVPDEWGGRDLVVAGDGRSAWAAGPVPWGWDAPAQTVVRLSLTDGAELGRIEPSGPVSLVRCRDGRPALVPAGGNGGRSRLHVRRGSRAYVRTSGRTEWLATAGLPNPRRNGPPGEDPHQPSRTAFRRQYRYAFTPGETHFAGPGVELPDGGLVHAGTVYDGRGLQPGGSFVVRREAVGGAPLWVFRTDRKATALDADERFAYVGYEDGELVALDLRDGTAVRHHLTIGAVTAVPTALTIAGPGRLLVGTGDGRILDCSLAQGAR